MAQPSPVSKFKLTVIIPTYNQADLITVGLDSIPTRDDVETIVVNDGSTDDTFDVIHDYIKSHQGRRMTLLSFTENKGVSRAVNAGLDKARGEYVVLLGSDGDYFLPGAIDWAIDNCLNGDDLIYFDVIDNTDFIRALSPKTVNTYVGSTKFMRREFIGATRYPLNRRRAEDVPFNTEIMSKRPKMAFTHKILKHYNYPREGSLTWNARHGVTDKYGFSLAK